MIATWAIYFCVPIIFNRSFVFNLNKVRILDEDFLGKLGNGTKQLFLIPFHFSERKKNENFGKKKGRLKEWKKGIKNGN